MPPLQLYGGPAPIDPSGAFASTVEAELRGGQMRLAATQGLAQQLQNLGLLRQKRADDAVEHQRRLELLEKEYKNREALEALREQVETQKARRSAAQGLKLRQTIAQMRAIPPGKEGSLYAGEAKGSQYEALGFAPGPAGQAQAETYLLRVRPYLSPKTDPATGKIDRSALDQELKLLQQPSTYRWLDEEALVGLGQRLLEQGTDPKVLTQVLESELEAVPRSPADAQAQYRDQAIKRFSGTHGQLAPAASYQQTEALQGSMGQTAQGAPQSLNITPKSLHSSLGLDLGQLFPTAQTKAIEALLDEHYSAFGRWPALNVGQDGRKTISVDPRAPEGLQSTMAALESILNRQPIAGATATGSAMAPGVNLTPGQARTLGEQAPGGPAPAPAPGQGAPPASGALGGEAPQAPAGGLWEGLEYFRRMAEGGG